MKPRTWRELFAETTEVLTTVGASDDARWLVSEASGLSQAELVLGLDDPAPAGPGAHLSAMVARRVAGEPLQYTLGRWGFRKLDLMVDRRVLIPRPETEQVVEAALTEARRLASTRRLASVSGLPAASPLVMADLGTGSGAIALSLAAELVDAQVWATDVSADALDVAGANLCGLAGYTAARVRLVEGSWFDPLPNELRGRLDVVVSNPPYVADDEPLPSEVQDWEPMAALRAGPTGLECLRSIVSAAPSWLSPDGVLVVEIAPCQAAVVVELAIVEGFAAAEVRPDLAGLDRMLVARL